MQYWIVYVEYGSITARRVMPCNVNNVTAPELYPVNITISWEEGRLNVKAKQAVTYSIYVLKIYLFWLNKHSEHFRKHCLNCSETYTSKQSLFVIMAFYEIQCALYIIVVSKFHQPDLHFNFWLPIKWTEFLPQYVNNISTYSQ